MASPSSSSSLASVAAAGGSPPVDEYEEFKNQGKFKSFVADFTAQLQSFDKAKEWADLIKCLQRLTRVLSKYNMFPVVPEKALFCKRLAQCCNPALPPGVHQKTLETYEIVFEQIGRAGLAKNLAHYSAGLFPLFQYASMQVKPKFIELIQKFYLPLGQDLMPCLSGLVTSLVPGLEESNAESYPKILKLFDALAEATSTQAVFHAMWKTLSLNPSIRIGACHYLLERLPKVKSPSDIDIFLPNRSTLVLNAIINSLSDNAMLVQRSVLDILVAHFRLDEQPFGPDGLVRLVQRILYIPLKREASLTRRVYSWLLGETASVSDNQTSDPLYFDKYSKLAVVIAIENIFSLPVSSAESASLPYRILQQLFDKPEVSAPIIFDILPFVLRRLHTFKEGFPFSAEVIAQTNQLIDSLQPEVTWRFINDLVIKEADGLAESQQLNCVAMVDSLTEKMLELNNIEAQNKFLPLLLKTLFAAAQKILQHRKMIDLLQTLQLSLKIVGKIHPSVPPMSPGGAAPPSAQIDIIAESFSIFVQFYNELIRSQLISMWDDEATDTEAKFLSKVQSTVRLRARSMGLDPATNLLTPSNSSPVHVAASGWAATLSVRTMDIASQILVALYSHFKIPPEYDGQVSPVPPSATASPPLAPASTTNPKLAAILAQQAIQSGASPVSSLGLGSSRGPVDVPAWLQTVWDAATSSRHPLAAILAIRTFVNIVTLPPNASMTPQLLNAMVMDTKMCHKVSLRLWELLRPSLSIVHYQAAVLFSALRDFVPEICEEVISTELITQSLEQRVQGLQRFALLWRLTGELSASSVGNSVNSIPFTKNLFQMLDTLNDEQPMAKLAGRTWLADSISKIERILDPLFVVLLDKNTSRSSGFYTVEYDCRRVLYVFKILQWIIECDFRSFMQYVIEKGITKDVLALLERQVHSDGTPSLLEIGRSLPSRNRNTENSPDQQYSKPKNYLDLLVLVSLRFISGQVSPKANPDFISKNSVVQTTSANFLQYLLQKVTNDKIAAELARTIQEPVLQNLAQAVSLGNLILQAQLLGLLRAIILIDYSRSASVATSVVGSTSAPAGTGVSNTTPSPPVNSVPHLLAGAPSAAQLNGPSLSSSPSTKELASAFVPLDIAPDPLGRSPMFLQTIVIGLLQPNTDFNIRFYWLEFVTSCLPYLHRHVGTLIPPVIKCICDIINAQESFYDSVGSKDTMMLLRALNGIIAFLISGLDQDRKSKDATPQSASNASSSNVVSSFFRNIFTQGDSAETTQQGGPSPTFEAVSALLQKLPGVVESLIRVWGPPSLGHGKASKGLGLTVEFSSDEIHNRYAIQDQVLHILEPLYANFPTRLLTSTLYMWRFNINDSITSDFGSMSANLPGSSPGSDVAKLTVLEILNAMSNVSGESIFKSLSDIVKTLHSDDVKRLQQAAQQSKSGSPGAPSSTVLTPSSTTPVVIAGTMGGAVAVTTAAESPPVGGRRSSRPSATAHNQDSIVADFLSFFCEFGTKPVTDASCSNMFAVCRELLASHNPHAILLLFRAVDTFLPKTPKTTLKRLKREYQDVAQRTIDSLMSIACRTFVDYSASWRAEARFFLSQDDPNMNVGSLLPNNSMNNVGLPTSSDETASSESGSESSLPQEHEISSMKRLLCLQSLSILSTKLSTFLEKAYDGEKDKMTAIVSQMSHQLIFMVKQRSTADTTAQQFSSDLATASLSALVSFSLSESIDIKAWRKEVLDLFLYNTGFFRSDPKQLKQWGVIVNQIFKDDKTMWGELIRLVTKSLAPQNIFVSKYDENKARALSVKRLAFVIYSGSIDQYTDQLPLIQEKLVDALKIRDYGKTISKVLLCLRVLLMRVSANALRVFWPVILAELIRIFESYPPDPELALAAAKFLDLSLVLHQEDFNIFDWIFVTDNPFPSNRQAAFKPFVERAAQLADIPNSQAYMPQRPAPLISINKLESSGVATGQSLIDLGTGRMTWQGFAVWLSQFSSLQYGNRIAAIDPQPDQVAIDAIILHDFTSSKTSEREAPTLIVKAASSSNL